MLYARLGVILLRAIQSETAVGYFSSAERLVAAASLVHMMFINAIYPAMSRLAVQNRTEMGALAARCLRLLILITLPLATFIFLLSADIIQFLYGSDFSAATSVLQIVVWGIVLQGVSGYLGVLAMAVGKEGVLARVRLATLIVFVCSATIFIGSWSYLGLAYAIVLSEAFIGAVMYLLLRREIRELRLLLATWRTGVACIAVLVAGVALTNGPALLQLSLIPVLLTVSMVAFGAIRLHDVRFLRQIVSSGRAHRSEH